VTVQEKRACLASLRLSPMREADIVEDLSQHLDDHGRESSAGRPSPGESQGAIGIR